MFRSILRCSAGLSATLLLLGCANDSLRPLPRAGREERVQVAGGKTVFVAWHGTGPDTLVLVHGGPWLGSDYLAASFGPLAEGRTIIRYDQRSRGASDPETDTARVSPDQDVDDLDTIVRALKLTKVSLLGDHYGALIAARYAARAPERVSKLVLTGPLYYDRPSMAGLAFAVYDSAQYRAYYAAGSVSRDTVRSEKFCREFWGFFVSPMTVIDTATRNGLAPYICRRGTIDQAMNNDLNNRIAGLVISVPEADAIPNVLAPTLVVSGNGNAALLSIAEVWAARLATGRLFIAKGWPQFPWVRDPDGTFSAIRGFLDRGDTTGTVKPVIVTDTTKRP